MTLDAPLNPQTDIKQARAAHGGFGRAASFMTAPAVIVLAVGSIAPLLLTLWFSGQRYNLLEPELRGFVGLANYRFLVGDGSFWGSLRTTLVLTVSVLLATVTLGTFLAVLFNQEFFGRGAARLLAISPFFIMPTVSALVWKNLIMHPVYGLVAQIARAFGFRPVDGFADHPLAALIVILSWGWLPFALLILLTALQSLDEDQREAARMDGAGLVAQFVFIVLPHLRRAIAVVTMMETIYLLSVFAEIFVTTSGGPGSATTNLAYLIYGRALLRFDIGGACAGGVIAVVLANGIAALLARSIGKGLDA